MEKFYIITNYTKDGDNRITRQIKVCIESYGKTCILCEKNEKEEIIVETIPENIDCALVIGGDGTFIQASRLLFGHDVPMLGINMGTLGYLTEVEVQNVEEAIAQLMRGEYSIERRMMLYGSVFSQGTDKISDVALNDIVLNRDGLMKIVHFDLYVNGQLLNSYQADGLIVSTPTGSTAYNLSAGGPIVEPTASLMVITPICSHALLNSRSIVFSDEDEITIQISSRKDGQIDQAAITFDGDDFIPLQTGDKVVIKKAWETAQIIKLSKISFLETLREKMKGH